MFTRPSIQPGKTTSSGRALTTPNIYPTTPRGAGPRPPVRFPKKYQIIQKSGLRRVLYVLSYFVKIMIINLLSHAHEEQLVNVLISFNMLIFIILTCVSLPA